MRLPFVSRRAFSALALAHSVVLKQLAEAENAARRLPQNEIEMERNDLRRRVKDLVATVDQLRAGIVDDAQTAELRRQLAVERRANCGLEQRLYEMTLANQLHDRLDAPNEEEAK
ncbi:hypothetical protein ACH44C_34510 [Streptomyces purpureus]|uniref:hypothetical protein n=1 Tax=Streptomyces purpureus TaxID=1951 RepID=UPI0037B848DF